MNTTNPSTTDKAIEWWDLLEITEKKRLTSKYSDKTYIFYYYNLKREDIVIIYKAEHPVKEVPEHPTPVPENLSKDWWKNTLDNLGRRYWEKVYNVGFNGMTEQEISDAYQIELKKTAIAVVNASPVPDSSSKENFTSGEWLQQGPKIQEKFGDQTYYTIHVKNSFDCVGFFYPYCNKEGEINHSNITRIVTAVNNFDAMYAALKDSNTQLQCALEIFKSYIPFDKLPLYKSTKEDIEVQIKKSKELLSNINL